MKSVVSGVRGEPMARHTSFHIGGPADVFLTVRTTDDLVEAVLAAREKAVPFFLLGGGTNILVSDAGVRGIVIENKVIDVKVDGLTVTATAGTPYAHLVSNAARHGVAGLEFGATIPGTIGGAIHGNAGAWGGETKDVLTEAALLDPATGEVRITPAGDLDMSYRHTALQGSTLVVLQGTFRGQPGETKAIVRRIKEIANERLAKQPLNVPNTGSIFKNPPGDSAGRLVDAAGGKGLRVGDAMVSEKHANFIVNTGEATASDVRALIRELQRRVRERFGVELKTEVEFIGDWADE